jgi:hypothetical protein
MIKGIPCFSMISRIAQGKIGKSGNKQSDGWFSKGAADPSPRRDREL